MNTIPKVAPISGLNGHYGCYLAEFLLSKDYMAHGIKRRAHLFDTQWVDHLHQDQHLENVNIKLNFAGLIDSSNLVQIIRKTQPDEVYNLITQSHVAVGPSPQYTTKIYATGVLRLLETICIKELETKPHICQDSASELYGLVRVTPQKRTIPSYPLSPYGAATKVERQPGAPSVAKHRLGRTPEFKVQQMCHEMVAADLQAAQRHALLEADDYEMIVGIE